MGGETPQPARPSEPVVDPVEEADRESFPASDPPARTVVTGVDDRPIPPDGDEA